jgi:hypothetical protein
MDTGDFDGRVEAGLGDGVGVGQVTVITLRKRAKARINEMGWDGSGGGQRMWKHRKFCRECRWEIVCSWLKKS